jgi:hypothetical protein
MEKVIRDGKVAVIYSPNWGAGWYSWHNFEALVYHPTLVEMIEEGRHHDITEELCKILLGLNDDNYLTISCVEDLKIEWLPVGTQFRIDEYDGNESIIIKEDEFWLTA